MHNTKNVWKKHVGFNLSNPVTYTVNTGQPKLKQPSELKLKTYKLFLCVIFGNVKFLCSCSWPWCLICCQQVHWKVLSCVKSFIFLSKFCFCFLHQALSISIFLLKTIQNDNLARSFLICLLYSKKCCWSSFAKWQNIPGTVPVVDACIQWSMNTLTGSMHTPVEHVHTWVEHVHTSFWACAHSTW